MPTRMSATSYSGAVVYICTSVIKESLAAARVPFAASVRVLWRIARGRPWCHGKRCRVPGHAVGLIRRVPTRAID